MLTKAVTRQWFESKDYIRHTLPVISKGVAAQDEAMLAAIKFWDPWQHLEHDARYAKFQVWLEKRGPVPIG